MGEEIQFCRNKVKQLLLSTGSGCQDRLLFNHLPLEKCSNLNYL